ncbi:hypothetical protein ABPG72_016639 [Tetrahymena utriculariae]
MIVNQKVLVNSKLLDALQKLKTDNQLLILWQQLNSVNHRTQLVFIIKQYLNVEQVQTLQRIILQGNIQCSFISFNCDPNQCNNQFCDFNQQCQSINICKQYTEDKSSGSCQWNKDLKYCVNTCASVELSKCGGTIAWQTQLCIPTTKGFCQPKSGICTLENCTETICDKYTIVTYTNPSCKIQDPNQCESFCLAISGKCIPKDDTRCTNKQNTQELCETQSSYCQYSYEGVYSAKDVESNSSQKNYECFQLFNIYSFMFFGWCRLNWY